jgi:hypothetical protein
MVQDTDKTIMFDPSGDSSDVAAQAIADPTILAALVESLSGDDRRIRQFSASALDMVSETDVDLLVGYVDQLSDALFRPEAQTRWQALEALERLVSCDPANISDAVAGAESCLFDETSGIVCIRAFRFLCVYGATTSKRAERVWSLIDEAIQCYHGDPGFNEMLTSLLVFAGNSSSKKVKKALVDRMSFDANSGRGGLKHRATQIIEAAGV